MLIVITQIIARIVTARPTLRALATVLRAIAHALDGR